MTRKTIAGFIFLGLITACGQALAQDWQAVTGREVISRLFTDTVMEATLKDNVQATARYNADGSGELQAWATTLRVSGKSRVMTRPE